jgi:hypothetical protein
MPGGCRGPRQLRVSQVLAHRLSALGAPLLLRLGLLLLHLGRIVVVIIVVIRLKYALAICTEQQDKGDRQDQLC